MKGNTILHMVYRVANNYFIHLYHIEPFSFTLYQVKKCLSTLSINWVFWVKAHRKKIIPLVLIVLKTLRLCSVQYVVRSL